MLKSYLLLTTSLVFYSSLAYASSMEEIGEQKHPNSVPSLQPVMSTGAESSDKELQLPKSNSYTQFDETKSSISTIKSSIISPLNLEKSPLEALRLSYPSLFKLNKSDAQWYLDSQVSIGDIKITKNNDIIAFCNEAEKSSTPSKIQEVFYNFADNKVQTILRLLKAMGSHDARADAFRADADQLQTSMANLLKEAYKQKKAWAGMRVEKLYDLGLNCYDTRDYEGATKFFYEAAEQGHAIAQYNLSTCYVNGLGCKKDPKKAFEWCEKAANQGLKEAQYHLGNCYAKGRSCVADLNKAFEWYLKAASQGNSKAQFNLALCYEQGLGCEKDPKKAFECYLKAADQGVAEAQYNLAMYYEQGLACEKDPKKAFECYLKAAGQGYDQAQYNLGLCYTQGLGCEKDPKKAFECYLKAAGKGHDQAQCSLGLCYIQGLGCEKDSKKAFECYLKAAGKGYTDAQCNLGRCYTEGFGCEKDLKKAVEWYQKAANQGYASAQCNLGTHYFKGLGCEKDLKKAVALFQKSANQGLKEAQFNMGLVYNIGLINQKIDILKARDFFLASAKQGFGSAQIELAKLLMKRPELETQDSGSAIHWLQRAEKHNTMESMLLQSEYYISKSDRDTKTLDVDDDNLRQALFCLETAQVFKESNDVSASLVEKYFSLINQAQLLSQAKQNTALQPDVEQEKTTQQDLSNQSASSDLNDQQIETFNQSMKQLVEEVLRPSDKFENSFNNSLSNEEDKDMTRTSASEASSGTSSQSGNISSTSHDADNKMTTQRQVPSALTLPQAEEQKVISRAGKTIDVGSSKNKKLQRTSDDTQTASYKRYDQLRKISALKQQRDQQAQAVHPVQLSEASQATIISMRSIDFKKITFPELKALFADPWFKGNGLFVHVRNNGKNIGNKTNIRLTNSKTKSYATVGTHFEHGKKLERKELNPNFIKDVNQMLKDVAGL